ncbi:MAG: AAA family ATPase [Lachnospiraceae bacterium]|nr:AAA family ATPase [Lachnospiraceae bacterium]
MTSQTLPELCRDMISLYRSGISLFILKTNYEEDIDDVAATMYDRRYFRNHIVELSCGRLESEEGVISWSPQVTRYQPHDGLSLYPMRRRRFADTALKEYDCKSPYYTAMAIEQLACLSGKSRQILLILRGADQLFSKAARGDAGAVAAVTAMARLGSISAARKPDGPSLFVLMSASGTGNLSPSLEPYTQVFEPVLPDDDTLRALITAARQRNNDTIGELKESTDTLLNTFRGLNRIDVERILTRAYLKSSHPMYERGRIIREIASEEKKQLAKKAGLLEWIEPVGEDKIGGMDEALDYLKARARIYEDISLAAQNGILLPKGILISGIPGTGKSLLAKLAGSIFKRPLIKLDVGRLMGKYVGESEENLWRALKLAEAMSPCVLWIDELEKSFAGAGRSSENDTFKRVFSSFLTWMQEKTCACYVIATANDVSALPPEFKRKGRFDEKFCCYLPTAAECRKIFEIHLTYTDSRKQLFAQPELHKELNAAIDNVLTAAGRTQNFFIGADIESLVNDLYIDVFGNRGVGQDSVTASQVISRLNRLAQSGLAGVQNYGITDAAEIEKCYQTLKSCHFRTASAQPELSADPTGYDAALMKRFPR